MLHLYKNVALLNLLTSQYTMIGGGVGTLGASVSFPSKITVGLTASQTELWAAHHLSYLLAMPVIDTDEFSQLRHERSVRVSQIAVGNEAAVALGMDPEGLVALGDDAFVVTCKRGVATGSVAIASSSGSARGALNGAFAFLRALGFEFLAQDETVRPDSIGGLPADLDLAYSPPFESRDMAAVPVAGPGGQRAKVAGSVELATQATNLSAALGFNGAMAFAPVGGKMGPLSPPGYTATAFNLLTDSGSTLDCGPGQPNASQKWQPCPHSYAQHPEWFACMDPAKGTYPYGNHISLSMTTWPCPPNGPHSVSGVRGSAQPCWANSSLIETMESTIRSLARRNPATRIVSLSGMDGTGTFIQCPTDIPYMRDANSTGGGNFFAANQLAAALAADDNLDVGVMIDAYELTQFPPKPGYKFHPGVIVRVALTDEMGYDGLTDLPKSLPLTDTRNKDMVQRLQAFAAATDRLYIWEYTYHGQYVLSPLPNYFVVAENMALFHKLGVRGWFAESVCCHPREEMVELKVYLWGRLAFDPTLDATKLTEEFLRGYYTPAAAPHIMHYLKMMDAASRARGGARSGKPRPFKTNSPEKREEDKWAWGPHAAAFDNATVLDAAQALASAASSLAAGSDERYKVRVAQAMVAVEFVAFYRWNELRAYAAESQRAWPMAATVEEELDLFTAALSCSGLNGGPITSIVAAIAPNASANAGGQVSVAEFRNQVLAHTHPSNAPVSSVEGVS